MAIDHDGKRIRGFCENCNGYVYGNTAKLCEACYRGNKAGLAISNADQHRQNVLASKRNWYYNNKEKAKAKHQEWLANNKERIKQYEADHVVERRHHTENRRARLLDCDEGITASEWKELIQLYGGLCVYCLKKPTKLEQDHVVPLSQGGKHSLDNVVPSCLECNRSKGSNFLMPKHPRYILISYIMSKSKSSKK